MIISSRPVLFAGSLVLAAMSGHGLADEAPDGETLYTERGCVYCHGPAGREPALPEYPKLAGQNAAYLTQQTRDIRSTTRDNGYTGMMQPAVVGISDEEIAAISAYLAAQSR
jgi:cytochrome c